ncbi:hypothetical protein BsWGS_24569 [Bradybaena similaris]
MPKTGAPISHDAIKRSLRSKFKLILSENRILVETINGYVKRAEKVYKEMEATDDVTPKQFSKAMEKLERAYSACVRLILVASDLFEKGDSESVRSRDIGLASLCGSETSVFSSESSGTITDTNHTRKAPNEKGLHRRSRSSDVHLHDGVRLRSRPQPASRKCRMADVLEAPGMEASNTESDRLFNLGELDSDQLIELQQFLHGLENEKQQTDHPNPCFVKEKQLPSSKIQREKDCTDNKEDGDGLTNEPTEELELHSLPQKLKVLKSIIENFRDRSPGDERVAQVLSDIRELVLKHNEATESMSGKDPQPECDGKDGYNMQVSPSLMSESLSTDNHHRLGQLCSRLCEDQDDVKDSYGNQLNQSPADALPGNKQKEGSGILVRTPQAGSADVKSQIHQLDSTEKALQTHAQQARHDQVRTKERASSCQQQQATQLAVLSSPARPPPPAPGAEQDDINQIIVNKIVDMVSAKLAPRLHKSCSGERSIFSQHASGRAAESNGRDELSRAIENVNSPTQLTCNCFPHAVQQGNYCGNCGRIPKYHLYYESGQNPHELQTLQRRTNRPKMVSFVEDFDSTSQCKACNSRYTCDTKQQARDTSPPPMTCLTYPYKDSEAELQQNFISQSDSRYTSPHKKRTYNVLQHRTNPQQLQHFPIRRILHSEDMFVAEHGANMNKDEESERAEDSEQEVRSDHQVQPLQQQDLHCKTVSAHESLPWGKRSDPKSQLVFDTRDYRGMHQTQRGATLQHQIAAQRNDSFTRNLNPDIQQVSQAAVQERELFSPPTQTSESGSVERNKACPNEGTTRFPYRLAESALSNQAPADFSDCQGESASEHCSPNGEWLQKQLSQNQLSQNQLSQNQLSQNQLSQNQLSQTSVTAHSQQAAEGPRCCAPRMPRSLTTPTQSQLPGLGYSSSLSSKGVFGKMKGYEPVLQTSVSSCDGSPAFSRDDKLHGDNTSSHDESDGKESKSQCPEVICIDTMQLHADASRTITLSNLPLDMDEEELLHIFKKYGKVTKIYYIRDRNTGLFQGRAYGKFSNASEAFLAAEDLQTLVIDGHEVNVQLYVNTQ